MILHRLGILVPSCREVCNSSRDLTAMSNDKPPVRTGLSLYANLLDPTKSAPGTISSAPVTYNKTSDASAEDEATKKQQALAGN